jgi:alpha-glucuronidase
MKRIEKRSSASVGACIGALVLTATCLLGLGTPSVRAEDGYRLWLRYDPITDAAQRPGYASALAEIVFVTPSAHLSPTLAAAQYELATGIRGLLGVEPQIRVASGDRDTALGEEGYRISLADRRGRPSVTILANRDIGVLYGAFALLRHVQSGEPIERLSLTSAPRIQRRILNHWDNLNRTVERGYAGFSLWEWHVLPDVISPRYRDYARANASIGINGTVLTNVNANALILSPDWLVKVAALADVFRPYGIRVYLTARFSAPVEIGGLRTADPLEPAVAEWWRAKADEIYRVIPDFGGFLVKANSEGQPGPQDYGRTHADGANMLADAVAPHGGLVMWRAFVYSHEAPDDRAKQAYNEFKPLDGKFRPNVLVQIKNGPIDFMPREPFSPLFGAMPQTALALELQITQEYLGQGTNLAFLGPLFEETLRSDTFRPGAGATVARVIDGSLDGHPVSAIAGVANIGNDRNWTGHPLHQASWYAFGRLAWDHTLTSATIADEWIRLTFDHDEQVLPVLKPMLLESREAVVNYEMPLGLHHLMAEGHHYGPGPWVDMKAAGRPDWTSVYYHRASKTGIGFDRTPTGSNALEQYAEPVQQSWGDPRTCPEELLLWFHHLPWDWRMHSGRTLWDELCLRYQLGVDTVRQWRTAWPTLKEVIDQERFEHVAALLEIQEDHAVWWRDACLQYFRSFSERPLPSGVEPPAKTLADYQAIELRYLPGNPSGR